MPPRDGGGGIPGVAEEKRLLRRDCRFDRNALDSVKVELPDLFLSIAEVEDIDSTY